MEKKVDKKLNIKSEKGFTVTDLICACFIIMIFVTVIASLMYMTYYNNIKASLTSNILIYAIQILEDIDKISYDEVDSSLASTYYSKFSIPDGYDIDLQISDYTEEDEVIKIVKLTISYTLLGETEQFVVQRLKIKELALAF